MLYISFTSMSDFRKCPRYYYYRHKLKIERKSVNTPYLRGKVVQFGICDLYKKIKDYIPKMLDYYNTLKKDALSLPISQDDMQDVVEQRYIAESMVKAYARRYAVFIRDTIHLKNEIPLKLQLGNCTFVGYIDNLFKHNGNMWMHELKTSKELTVQRVRRIQTDLQHASYYYVFHKLYGKKYRIHKILYDIIRVPSIRKKQSETYEEYLNRLVHWYDTSEAENKFYQEPLDEPKLKEKEVFNTLTHIADDILRCNRVEDYYMDTDSCFDKWGECMYYQLCHEGGLSKENMTMYRKREDLIRVGK